MVTVKTNLERCQVGLKLWSRTSLGNITKQLATIRNILKEAEAKAVNTRRGQSDMILSLKEELRTFLMQEEKLW